VFTYGNGNLGLPAVGNGFLRQVHIADADSATPTFTLVSAVPIPVTAVNNDATECLGPPVDLSLTKTAPAALDPEQNGHITWTLTVSNDGPGSSSGYVVTDAVPAAVTNVATTTPGCTATGDSVQCIGGTLTHGATATITITGTVPSGTTAPVQNTATVTGNESDPSPGGNTSTSITGTGPPTVQITGPPPGSGVPQGGQVPAVFGCAGDATPLTCAGTVTYPDGHVVPISEGGGIPTDVPGVYTITVTVTDAFGRSVTTTSTYEVFGPPAVTISGPVDGGVVTQGDPLTALFACSAPAGVASCTATAANGSSIDTSIPGTYTFIVTVVDKLGQTVTRKVTYTVKAKPGPIVTHKTANQLALECSGAHLVLLDVRQLGGHVRFQGVTAPANAGRLVPIRLRNDGKVVARAKVQPDGSFETTGPLPRKSIRKTNNARYRAELDGDVSLDLKLVRRMLVNSLSVRGGKITIQGDITLPLAKPIATIRVRQRTECGGPGKIVARLEPDAKGHFKVTFARPAGVDSAIYRLATFVRKHNKPRKHYKRYPTYTLVRGVNLF
jgi:uncharacterized repeat protein (TIGR01451 family)